MKLKLTLITLFFAFAIHAQTKEKDKAYNLIAERTCECVSKLNFSDEMTLEDKTQKLGSCMVKSYAIVKKKNKYLKKNSIADFVVFGEELGGIMADVCPEVVLSVFSTDELVDIIAEDEEDEKKSNSEVDKKVFLEGNLESYHNDVISYIKLKDEFKKDHLFIIIEEFEGSELLISTNLNQKIKVVYEEYSIFDLSEKQYVTKKAIKSLEIIN